MRKFLPLLAGVCLLAAGCSDSELIKRIDDLEQRVEKLEQLCNSMNTNLSSMQSIVEALENGDYITAVEPLVENGSVVGYTIKFAKGAPIVVYNGEDGSSPVIAVGQGEDGNYYWTLNGEWLTDEAGNRLPVSGKDGMTPELKIEEGCWYVSYDGGESWTKLDGAAGDGIRIEMDENYVWFILPDGTKVTVPRVPDQQGPDEPSVPHILYAVGQESVAGKGYYYATLWKDGQRFQLSDGSADGFCNDVCVDGDMVYVVGCEATGELFDDGFYEPYHLNVGTMWQFKVGDEANAVKTALSDGKRATSPVAVAAAGGNVYAAGFEMADNNFDRVAVYWKNGTMTRLTDGTTDALAYCVMADGDDVYVGGYVQPEGNPQGGIACIWKNGQMQSLTDGSTIAKVNALYMDNGKVYAAGAERVSGGNWRGVLWIDGVPSYFTEEVGTEVTGLYVKDGEYIIEGNMTDENDDIVACTWTVDGVEVYSEGMSLCQGLALAVAGSDVYVAGSEYGGFDMDTFEEIYHAHIWKNGVAQEFETVSPDNITIWGLACALTGGE